MDAAGNWLPSSLGYRLNNPSNLNYAGQPGATPTTFGNGQEAQFATLTDGIAATERQLALDASRGLNLQERLSTWATGNKDAYVLNVSSWLGVSPETPLSALVGQDSVSIPLDTGSTIDFSGSVDGEVAGLSLVAWLGLGIATLGLAWALTD